MAVTERLPCGCPRNMVDTRVAGGFRLRRSLSLPCCALGLHHHREPRIVISLAGAFQTSHGGQTLAVDGTAAVYRPAGDEHLDRYPAPTDSLSFLLPADAAPPLGEPFAVQDAALPGLRRALCTEWSMRDPASNLIMEGLAHLATSIVLHRRPVVARGKPHWIGTIRDQLDACYANPPTLSNLAQSVNREVAYVAATFKRVYGTSIGLYLRELRLWKARDQMEQDGEISLVDIALQCGYSDQSHFTRQFKRLFHITPREYRQRHGFQGMVAAGTA
ncbi:MAG TPA: AraC family transcriptional regulator [Gammaproteobacteria bacterium]|nr:AraC family transcriptional regulator [Gammaproteobacteria bacterium]